MRRQISISRAELDQMRERAKRSDRTTWLLAALLTTLTMMLLARRIMPQTQTQPSPTSPDLGGGSPNLGSVTTNALLNGAHVVVYERFGQAMGWLHEHALLAALAVMPSAVLCLGVVRCARFVCSEDGAEQRSLWQRYIKVGGGTSVWLNPYLILIPPPPCARPPPSNAGLFALLAHHRALPRGASAGEADCDRGRRPLRR